MKKRGENDKRQREKRRSCFHPRWSFDDEVRIFFQAVMAGSVSLVSKAGNRMTWSGWSCNFLFPLSQSLKLKPILMSVREKPTQWEQ